MESDDVVEHIVEVDSAIEMRIKIPRVMNILEFTGTLEKARKMLKISEVEIPVRKRKYTKNGDKEVSKEEKLLEEYENGDMNERIEMAKKYGFNNNKHLSTRIFHIRKRLGRKFNGKENKSNKRQHKIFSTEEEKRIIKFKKKGWKGREIAEKLGYEDKQIQDKIQALKKNGKL